MTYINEKRIVKGQRHLRCGYTTGTCAAAAAKAAAVLLLMGENLPQVTVELPGKETALLEIVRSECRGGKALCGVIKDAGDDPDVTNGMMVCAEVRCLPSGEIRIDGGEGVGRVTRPGLDQPVGAAAINSVPRQMIREAVSSVLKAAGCPEGLEVIISIPGGLEKAAQTLNGMLGIEGGLSVLGTSGIVEPMSERALTETIGVEIRQKLACGSSYLIMAPGNYGLDFLREDFGIPSSEVVKISNYIGDSIDMAAASGAEGVLLTGHIGKLIKLAAGIMNTHSHQADGRMEIMTAAAVRAGAPYECLRQVLGAVATEAGLDALDAYGFLEPAMALIMEKIAHHLTRRAGQMPIEAVVFSNERGLLGKTAGADAMMAHFTKEGLEVET